MQHTTEISIIVPVVNEAATIKHFTRNLLGHSQYFKELIIIDGHSHDQTYFILKNIKHPQLITRWSEVSSRAQQMNLGARIAHGNWFLFLHADTVISKQALQALNRVLAKGNLVGGAFSFALNTHQCWARLTEFNVNLRTALFKLPYGDQGIFVRRDVFQDKLKGYKNLPMMEDLDLVRRLRKLGHLKILKEKLVTSSRKWQQQGYWPTTIKNAYALISFLLRQRSYRTKALIIFVKYPQPGAVKTRLGQAIGMKQASVIYERLARQTIKNLYPVNQAYDTIICYDNQTKLGKYQVWLDKKYQYLPQARGDLGIRMNQAFTALFRKGYGQLLLIGTDCPALNKHHIHESFTLLNKYDVVVGPAQDGGYYLIGLNKSQPFLFDDITWSTERVLKETLKRAQQNNLKVKLLEKLSDIDRPEDLVKLMREPVSQ